jgi:predicted nucleic acid-binding protein
MTLVVADASPILYLIAIGAIDLLPKLYPHVVLPPEVVAELNHPNAPLEVQHWASKLPNWIEVVGAKNIVRDSLDELLDPGEAAAIRVAEQLSADLVLIDDRDARRLAEKRGLRIAGTIGVLESAASKGMLELKKAFEQLERTNFQIDPQFLRDALARDAVRRK